MDTTLNNLGLGTPFAGIDAVLSLKHLSAQVRQELSRVYGAVGATLLAAAAGCMASLRWGWYASSNGMSLPALMAIGAAIYLSMGQKAPTPQRFGVLLLFGALQGLSVAPLVHVALDVAPDTVFTAILMTATIFVCFSLSALLSAQRSYLYLGGILGSAVSLMFWGSFLNLFLGTTAIPLFNLYAGLVVFCGYILYDTQLILFQIESGRRDFISHALNLFIDIIAIFVRILIILLRNSEKEKRRKNERR